MGGQHRRRIQRREISAPNIVTEKSLEKLSWLFFGLAILYASLRAVWFPDLSGDNYYRITTVKNFLSGQGWGWFHINFDDLSSPLFQPMYKWPPLYSFLSLPLFAIFKDIHWPVSLVMIFSIVIFFGSWFLTLKILSPVVSSAQRALIWFFWGICFNPFLILQADGYLAMSLFSVSFFLQVWMIKKSKHFLGLSLLSGFFAGLAAATRFTYWPLVFVGPLTSLFFGMKFNRKLIRPAIYQSFISILFIGLTNIWGYFTTKAATVVSSSPTSTTVLGGEKVRATTDVAYRNYLYWDWFMLKALGLEDLFLYFKNILSLNPWESFFGFPFQTFFLIPSSIVLIIYFLIVYKQYQSGTKNKQARNILFVSMFGLFTLIVVNGTLAILTAIFAAVYSEIPRYYLVIYPFILFTFMMALFTGLQGVNHRPLIKKSLLIGIIVVMSCVGYVRAQRIIEQTTNQNNYWQLRHQAKLELVDILTQPSENPVIFFAIWGYWRESIAAYHGIPTEAIIKNGQSISTNHPVKIYFPIVRGVDQEAVHLITKFKNDMNAAYEGTLNEKWETVDIYSCTFGPGTYTFELNKDKNKT